MRATPTPRQQAALERLRYAAPLLRLMRCEAARVVWTVGDDCRICETHNFPACPPPVAPWLTHALAQTLPYGWAPRPGNEPAVNFDTTTGFVEVIRHQQHRYSDSNLQLWIPNWSPEPVPSFPQPLGPLLSGTLDCGGMGVLADWIDDHTADWGALTAALRSAAPDPFEPTSLVDEFRYAVFGSDSACWLIRTGEYQHETGVDVEGERTLTVVGVFGDEFWFIGFGVVGELGFSRQWCLGIPPPDGHEACDRLLATFPAPPEAKT